MKTPVLSTYKILKKKALNEDIDESWIDWAIEMIEAGFESDNLYSLASLRKPFNQFHLQELTDNVLQDLGLSYIDKAQTIKNYSYFIIKSSIDCPENYYSVLRELMEICLDLDMDKEYIDFYLLYFAKDDLTESENQWYWEGANNSNIDKIIHERFQKFIYEFEEHKPTNAA